jgi:hypothetical protein
MYCGVDSRDFPSAVSTTITPYRDSEMVVRELQQLMSNEETNKSATTRDCLGMTPLMICACSSKHDVELYHLVVDAYPQTLIWRDEWDGVALLYAIWNNAPKEIIQFLVECYKTTYPSFD